MKPNNSIYLKCSHDSFYRTWVEFLTPYHKLTSRERDVAARILAQYFRLKDNVEDPEVLRDILWSRKSRKDMMDSLGMTQAHFQMVLAKLKKAEVLLDGDINPRYIPHMGEDPRFMLQIIYDWSTEEDKVRLVKKEYAEREQRTLDFIAKHRHDKEFVEKVMKAFNNEEAQ